MMMKLLFLEYLYNLSDVKVIEEANFNLVYLWFLGLNPEDKLPDPSLLAKVRTQRMKDYPENVIEAAAAYAGEATTAAIEEAKDVLSDEKFLLQKGLRSLSDKDARVGSNRFAMGY